MLQRRLFLMAGLGLVLGSTLHSTAWAKDGGHNGDGHDGDGHDGHDGDGGGDDGGGDDGGGDDDGGKNDDGGTVSDKTSKTSGLNQDDALRELRKGSIISLKKALTITDSKLKGKVIDIRLTRTFGRPLYRIKVRQSDGVISTIRLDAKTGAFVGILGF